VFFVGTLQLALQACVEVFINLYHGDSYFPTLLLVCLSTVCLSAVCLYTVCLSACLSVCLYTVCLSAACLSVCLSVCLSACLTVCLHVHHQKPLALKGHERAITQIKYNRDGDLLFSVAKDARPTVWWSENGERVGTYEGHSGALWCIDVNRIHGNTHTCRHPHTLT